MEWTVSNVVQIAVYLITFSATWGSITARLKTLEQKVEKHNNVIERLYKCEESTKQAHKRIDEIKG